MDHNYDYCKAQGRPQIHFIYPIDEINIMTVEKLDILENEMNIILNDIATAEPQSRDKLRDLLPITVPFQGIIDYIALETDPQTKKGVGCKELTLDTGALALFRLGYTVYSPEFIDDQVHGVIFVHPIGIKLYHKDSEECNYHSLWLYLKELCDFIK